jgi:hypothetical protein
VSINHRGIAPDIELERDPKPSTAPVPADGPILKRDEEVRRAVKELKSMPNTHSGPITTASAR